MTRYGKIKVGVGIGFVAEGEMPPLGVEWEETMTQHSIAQDETVRLLLGRDSLVVGVREFAEIVDKQIFKVGSKNSLFRFWIYFRGKIGSKRGSVASYVTDFTYDLGRKETKR